MPSGEKNRIRSLGSQIQGTPLIFNHFKQDILEGTRLVFREIASGMSLLSFVLQIDEIHHVIVEDLLQASSSKEGW